MCAGLPSLLLENKDYQSTNYRNNTNLFYHFHIHTAHDYRLYAGVGIISIFLMFLGYDLMTADGKEFIIGTILPDFFFLGFLLIGSFLYDKHKTILYGLCGCLFVLLMGHTAPSFYGSKRVHRHRR